MFTQVIISNNIQREALVYVPQTYDPTKPTTLVITFHGFGSNPQDMMEITGWNTLADTYGFIVAYPRGLGRPSRWNSGDFPLVRGNSIDDVQFTRDIIQTLSQVYCIDAVFPNGYSNGGGMSNRLACELSDQISAFGSVAGAYNTPPQGCNPEKPVRVIAFHGTDDAVVNFNGDEWLHLPPILTWVATWAERNGCDPQPEITSISDEVVQTRYLNCEADVVFYEVTGGGHTWPGGEVVGFGVSLIGHMTQDINASQLMWEFFNSDSTENHTP
ncbi:MAG: PHB depolymerase family esterase [Phototrophicales bacterium]